VSQYGWRELTAAFESDVPSKNTSSLEVKVVLFVPPRRIGRVPLNTPVLRSSWDHAMAVPEWRGTLLAVVLPNQLITPVAALLVMSMPADVEVLASVVVVVAALPTIRLWFAIVDGRVYPDQAGGAEEEEIRNLLAAEALASQEGTFVLLEIKTPLAAAVMPPTTFADEEKRSWLIVVVAG
jgi:hypothetical protein